MEEGNFHWEAKGDWEGPGSELRNGKIADDKFVMDDGVENSHYALVFKGMDFEKITVDIELKDEYRSEALLVIASGDSKEGLEKLDEDKFEERRMIELENGENELELDVDWGDFAFFKIALYTYEEELSAAVKNVVIEGEKRGLRKRKEQLKDENEIKEDIENEEEKIPSFEDVEYKELECPECGEEFKTDIGLEIHMKTEHEE